MTNSSSGNILTTGQGSDGIRVVTQTGTGVGGLGGLAGTGTGGNGGTGGAGGKSGGAGGSAGTAGVAGGTGGSVAGLDGAAGLGTPGEGTVSVINFGSIVTRGIDSAGIRVIGDSKATVTNDGGTIWSGFSTDGVTHHGVAIDTTNDTALIQLQGIQGDGHVFGDINIAADDTINVTQGRTWFEGTINGKANNDAMVGTLDIFDGGKLVLCQEGWTNACDPSGWGALANWDPQSQVAADGPSFVHVDSFTVQSGGTLSYQLTPRSAPGLYPQVFANNVNIGGGTLNVQYLPGFYGNKTTYKEIISSGTPINGAGTGVNGTGFGAVKDNSVLLQTKAILDNNGQAIDVQATRTAFNQVPGLNRNEKAVGGGLEKAFSNLSPNVNPATTNSFNQLLGNLFTIDNAQDFTTILQELSGAQYAQVQQSVLFSLNPLNEFDHRSNGLQPEPACAGRGGRGDGWATTIWLLHVAPSAGLGSSVGRLES